MGGYISSLQEQFEDPLRPQRPPIMGSQALQALFRAEAYDQYRTQIEKSPANKKSRISQVYMPSVHTVKKQIPPADPKKPWPNGQVVWMEPTADLGLPHTRPPMYICLSRTIQDSELSSTLLHERVHISQRLHPKEWISCVEAWSMTPWSGTLPDKIQEQRRLNPDLLMAPLFAWKNEWVPLGIFNSVSSPQLRDCSLVWWNTQSRILSRDPPPGWTNFFGQASMEQEHPYELAAYLVVKNPAGNPAWDAIKSRLDSLPTSEV